MRESNVSSRFSNFTEIFGRIFNDIDSKLEPFWWEMSIQDELGTIFETALAGG
jgi:hypothetical protein